MEKKDLGIRKITKPQEGITTISGQRRGIFWEGLIIEHLSYIKGMWDDIILAKAMIKHVGVLYVTHLIT